MVKERALAHGITLSLDIADNVDTLTGDERKVKQVVFNLLSNAVKFTPDRGKVGIAATKADTLVQVAVWDTGVGIPDGRSAAYFRGVSTSRAGAGRENRGNGPGSDTGQKVCRAAWGHDLGGEHPRPREYFYLYAAGCRCSAPCTPAGRPGGHGWGPGARGRAGICGSPGVGCRRRSERSRSPPHLSDLRPAIASTLPEMVRRV